MRVILGKTVTFLAGIGFFVVAHASGAHHQFVTEQIVFAESGSGLALAGQRYRITLENGGTIEGNADQDGKATYERPLAEQPVELSYLRSDGSVMSICEHTLIEGEKYRWDCH